MGSSPNGTARAGLKRDQIDSGKEAGQRNNKIANINRDAGKNESSMAGGGFSDAVGGSSTMFLWVLEIWETNSAESGYDEGAHLNFQDISVDSFANPQVLQVAIKRSKTDPFRTGVTIYIGRTNCELCPVAAVLAYMRRRGPSPGPLFRFADGKPLARPQFVTEVKQALTMAGVDSTCFSGHSFRSGAATTAARRGIGDATIKMLGRWKSSAYQVYIKTPREQLVNLSRILSGGNGHHGSE